MADNNFDNNTDSLDAGFENGGEALDRGEASERAEENGQRILEKTNNREDLLVTGELGQQALNWYENYALGCKNEAVGGVAKESFSWQIGGDGAVTTIGEIDNYLTVLLQERENLRGQDQSEEMRAIDEGATAPTAESANPTERKARQDDLAKRILDVLTERFLAELAFMAKVAKKAQMEVAQAEDENEPSKLQAAGKSLQEIFGNLNKFVTAAEGEMKFSQGAFFDRYRDFKDNNKENEGQNYQADLQEWQRRFDQTTLGMDYQIKEQTQTLEGTFLDALANLKFMVNGNGLGEGGIAGAIQAIEKKQEELNKKPADATEETVEAEAPAAAGVAAEVKPAAAPKEPSILSQLVRPEVKVTKGVAEVPAATNSGTEWLQQEQPASNEKQEPEEISSKPAKPEEPSYRAGSVEEAIAAINNG